MNDLSFVPMHREQNLLSQRPSEAAYTLQWWMPVLLVLGAIAAESTQQAGASHTIHLLGALVSRLHLEGEISDLSTTNVLLRKVGHFSGYGLLALLSTRGQLGAFAQKQRRSLAGAAPMAAFIAILCTVTVASLDEWHQSFLAGRSSSIVDVLLDSAGATTFVLLYLAVRFINDRRQPGATEEAVR